jgi:hypothetical protein
MVGRTTFGGGMVWARGREVWMAGRKLREPESVTMVFRCDNGIFFRPWRSDSGLRQTPYRVLPSTTCTTVDRTADVTQMLDDSNLARTSS